MQKLNSEVEEKQAADKRRMEDIIQKEKEEKHKLAKEVPTYLF